MNFKRLLIIPAIGVIAALSIGFANTLAIGEPVVMQIGESDVACDPDGVVVESFGLEMDDSTSSYIRLSGIHEDCEGARLFVSVYNSTPTEIGRVREGSCGGGVGVPLVAGNTGANNTGNMDWCPGGSVPAADIVTLKIAIES